MMGFDVTVYNAETLSYWYGSMGSTDIAFVMKCNSYLLSDSRKSFVSTVTHYIH